MGNNKGFTLVELMLAAALTLVLLGLIMPFFIAQSTFSYNSTQNMSTGRAVDLAMLLIKKDILQTAFGVRRYHPELSVFVQDSNPDRLYLNFSGYLNIRGDMETLPVASSEQQAYKSYVEMNSVFSDGNKSTYQGHTEIKTLPFKLAGVPTDITKGSIGAIIYDGGAMEVDVKNTALSPDSLQGFQTLTFSGLSGLSNVRVAPAICYKVASNGLWRNAGSGSTPWGYPLLGANAVQGDADLFQVTDFQVRCQFVDAVGNVSWSPGTCTFGSGSCSADRLKRIEVTLAYQAKMRSGGWSAGTRWSVERRRVMEVSPRALAIPQ